MSWIGAIIIGLIAGALARLISSDPRNPQGCLITMVLGMLGAALFTWIGQTLNLYREGETAGLIGATLGALLVLGIWRVISKGR
jgi:uncharacterized membrane protein YeaQ/YmgE (transglycosylase-associated protein family)